MYKEDQAVKRYNDALSISTRKNSISTLKKFFTWIDENSETFSGLTPAEIVAWQKENPGEYEVLDLIQDYIRGLTKLRAN